MNRSISILLDNIEKIFTFKFNIVEINMSTNTNNDDDFADFSDDDIEFDAHSAFSADSEFDSTRNVEFDNNVTRRAFNDVERRELTAIMIEVLRDQS